MVKLIFVLEPHFDVKVSRPVCPGDTTLGTAGVYFHADEDAAYTYSYNWTYVENGKIEMAGTENKTTGQKNYTLSVKAENRGCPRIVSILCLLPLYIFMA